MAVLNFYDNLLGPVADRDFTLDFLEMGVQQHDLSALEAPFSEEEVWQPYKPCHLIKLRVPMGSLVGFIKLAGTSSSMICPCHHSRGHMSKFRMLNATFISLLPKKWMP